MKRVSILIISGSFGDGECGVGDFSFHLAHSMAHRLDETPSQFDVVVLTNTRAEAIKARHGGKTSADLDGQARWTSDDARLTAYTNFDFSLVNARRFRKIINTIKPSLILIQYPSKGFGWTLSIPLLHIVLKGIVKEDENRKSLIPLTMTLHEYRDAHFLRRIALIPLLNACRVVITPCPLEAEAISKVRKTGVTVIPDGNVFAKEIDETKYLKFKAKIDAIDSSDSKVAFILASQAEYLDDKWSPTNIELSALKEVVSDRNSNRSFIFNYGFVASSKAPMRLLSVFSTIRNSLPNSFLVVASKLNPKIKLHKKFLERAAAIENVLLLGSLPPILLRYVAEQCRLQLFTFKDGFTTKRSSLISALSFETPILTESLSGHQENLDATIVGQEDQLSSRAIEILSMSREEYECYSNEHMTRQRDFAINLDFVVIKQCYEKYLTISNG